MRATLLFISLMLAVCCASTLHAQALPDAPSTVVNAATVEVIPPTLQPVQAVGQKIADAPQPKVMDRKFMWLGGLVFATTAADMELTQRCQNAGTCVELNPTVPRARWAKYATNTATNVGVMYWAYRWKKQGKRLWLVPPLVDIGAHVLGLGSNLRFAW